MRIDEDGFLRAFLPTLSRDASVVVPPGDDCAALDLGGADLLLVAVDQVAAGVHYWGPGHAAATPPELVGRKLLARNLSDIAAMGGTARYALVAAGFPPDTDRQRLDAFAAGLRDYAREWHVHVIGGDLGGAGAEVASLTIIGLVPRAEVCRRAAGRAGERLFVTGDLGNSFGSGRHLHFTPRLPEGRWLAAGGWTRCMLDLSDGLLQDLGRLCAASQVQAGLDETALPVAAGADVRGALLDGEDYELLFSVAPERAAALRQRWPFATRLTEVGAFAAGPPRVSDAAGADLATVYGSGFDHFQTRSEG